MAALENEHGSILRGMMRSRGEGGMGRPVSFPDGLAELPRALADGLGARRRVSRVDGLAPRGSGWTVTAGGQSTDAEQVVLATPAPVTSALLAPVAPEAAEALRELPHAPVAVVTLGFRDAAGGIGMDLGAYGFVAARGEGIELLGSQYDSSVFSGRAPEGAVLVRGLLGGTFNPSLVDADDRRLVDQAVGDLRRAAGLSREPDFADVWRARGGIPQYRRGHAARVAVVDAALAQRPGLLVIGHALRGLGISASIRAATQAARGLAT